jgi:hypothetical protein
LVRRRSSPNSRSSNWWYGLPRDGRAGNADAQCTPRSRRRDRSPPRADPYRRSLRCHRAAGGPAPGEAAWQQAVARAFELWPDVLGNFALQVSHLVRQAALVDRARQAFLDRAKSGRAPRRWPPAAGREGHAGACPERNPCSSRYLLLFRAPGATAPLCRLRGCPRRQHRLTRLAQMQPLGNAVDK